MGESVSLVGRQLTVVAAPVQVFQLTDSTLAVGMLGLLQFPALVVGSFIGGALADAFDRRRILLIAQMALGATTVALALNASASSPAVWPVFLFTSLNALFAGIDSPARTATVPRLVTTALLPATYALRVLFTQTANAVGPAVAGIVIAQVSLASAYWIDTVTFGFAFVAILLMSPLPPHEGGVRPSWQALKEGFGFIRKKQELQGVFLIDIVAMVFGMPRALFPEMGLTVFGGTAATVGALYAAPGVGAIIAGVTSGWVGRVRHAGRATVVAVVVWGLGVTVFGLTTSLILALVSLTVAGGGDAISAVFRQTILQTTTPDKLRGRLSAVQIAVVAGGPRVGDAEAGVVAARFGVQPAAWSGGLLSIAGALVIARLLPAFRDWETPEPAAGDRS